MHEKHYDVAVVGGGPAGMMAAARAAECGARVVLLEKNTSLGKKLLLTGGGRCNLTNAEFDRNVFAAKFKGAARFLLSPFSQFGVEETLEFFHTRGMPTKVEAENRVFPESDRSHSVLDVLVDALHKEKVDILLGAEVAGFEAADGMIRGIRMKNGNMVRAHAYILATGGKSHPETGSTGDGFRWLRAIGHTIVPPHASLVPLRVSDSWLHALSGVSFPDVKLTILQNDERRESASGKLLFTHFGLSGPLALNMSRTLSEYILHSGPVTVSLDLFPHRSVGEIDKDILDVFALRKNQQVKNVLGELIPPRLILPMLSLSSLDSDIPVHSVSREKRLFFAKMMKDIRLSVSGLLGEDKSIVTSGGVALPEIDFKNMRSRLFFNLYCVGDILDIDRPSGGYSLQICWSTGWVAGNVAGKCV